MVKFIFENDHLNFNNENLKMYTTPIFEIIFLLQQVTFSITLSMVFSDSFIVSNYICAANYVGRTTCLQCAIIKYSL
jgi:hypothetical protein